MALFSFQVGPPSDIGIFKTKILLLIIQVVVVCIFTFGTLINFISLDHGQGDKTVNLFAISQAIFSAHKFNAASSSTRGQPGSLRVSGLQLRDLTWIHIVYDTIQGTVRLKIILRCIYYVSSSEGFVVWFDPFIAKVDLWWLAPYRLCFFVGV